MADTQASPENPKPSRRRRRRPPAEGAAKAKKADPTKIRFQCNSCKAGVKVDVKMADRYIQCPKCKKRIRVPASQAEADEDAADYDVSNVQVEVPKRCRECRHKLPKGALVCVNCGFDYRTGKHAELQVRTRIGETVTYGEVFSALKAEKVTELTSSLAGYMIPLMLVFWGVMAIFWFFVVPYIGEPGTTAHNGCLIGMGVALTLYLSLVSAMKLRAASAACSDRALDGVQHSPGNLLTALIYAEAIYLVAALPFLVLLGALAAGLGIDASWGAEQWQEVPDRVVNTGTVVGTALCLLWYLVYSDFAVAAYSVEDSLNPIHAFYWMAKCVLDYMLRLVVVLAMYVALVGPLVGMGYFAYVSFGEDALMFGILWGVLALMFAALYCYILVAGFGMLGAVMRKNSDW